MPSSQAEERFTGIPNEILEPLMKLHLTSNQWQVLLYVIRKTYGFHKKVDHIANKQIVEATKLNRHVTSRALKNLISMNIIEKEGKDIGIQRDWQRWNKLPEQATFEESTTGTKLPEQATLVDDECYQNRQRVLPKLVTALPKQTTNVTSATPATEPVKKKETIQKKLYKRKEYGEFKNVLLSDDEYQKLKDRFGKRVPEMIEALSGGIEYKGYEYKNHYAALLAWERRDKEGVQYGGPTRPPGTHKPGSQEPTPERYRASLKRGKS